MCQILAPLGWEGRVSWSRPRAADRHPSRGQLPAAEPRVVSDPQGERWSRRAPRYIPDVWGKIKSSVNEIWEICNMLNLVLHSEPSAWNVNVAFYAGWPFTLWLTSNQELHIGLPSTKPREHPNVTWLVLTFELEPWLEHLSCKM